VETASGQFSTEEPDHEGVFFVAALKPRLDSADNAAIDLFKNAPSNASYISWHTQNKIISLFAKQIKNELAKDGQVVQLNLSQSFVKNNEMHEIQCFVPHASTTGDALPDRI